MKLGTFILLWMWVGVAWCCDIRLNINKVGFCENPLRFISVNNDTVAYVPSHVDSNEIKNTVFNAGNLSYICYITLASYLCAVKYRPCDGDYNYCLAADNVIKMHISSGVCQNLSGWYHEDACKTSIKSKFSMGTLISYMVVVSIILFVVIIILNQYKRSYKSEDLMYFNRA